MAHDQEMHYLKLLEGLKQWHQRKVEGLNLIIEKEDADMDFGNGLLIKAGTERHSGVRIGILIALSLLGTLPLTSAQEEDGNDGE